MSDQTEYISRGCLTGLACRGRGKVTMRMDTPDGQSFYSNRCVNYEVQRLS